MSEPNENAYSTQRRRDRRDKRREDRAEKQGQAERKRQAKKPRKDAPASGRWQAKACPTKAGGAGGFACEPDTRFVASDVPGRPGCRPDDYRLEWRAAGAAGVHLGVRQNRRDA